MRSRLIDYDPLTGTSALFHPSVDGKTWTLEHQQDVTDIVEANKREFAAHDRARFPGTWHKVAAIPLSILFEWKREGKDRDAAFITKWLNDPDNRFFRTRPGKV